MDGTLRHDNTSGEARARELALLLESHKAREVVTLDFRALSMWTDFFVIGTASSTTHLSGLKRHLREFLRGGDVGALSRRSAESAESGWELIDMGDIVVHLMTREARDFYELERLWDCAAALK